jgi:hypothetical protein
MNTGLKSVVSSLEIFDGLVLPECICLQDLHWCIHPWNYLMDSVS